MIGPYDLCHQVWGFLVDLTHQNLKKILKFLKKKTKKTKNFLEIHVVEPDKKIIQEYLNKNYTF